MSTSFSVYPSNSNIPSFDEVLRLSNTYLKNMLAGHGIIYDFQIDVQIRKKELDTVIPFIKAGPAIWDEDEYAWFVITDQPGGCDAYYWNIEESWEICDGMISTDEEDRLNWEKRFESGGPKLQYVKSDLEKCLELGYYWHFRRSAGQPSIVNLSYGMIAAAFAKLTDGIIYSNDSAWDYDVFPVRADEFLEQYFNPDCRDASCADWAIRCLDDIRTTFQ